MTSVLLSVLDFLTLCLFWGAWLQYNTDAHQGGCRRVQFIPPETGVYFKDHAFLNLSIGIYASCEHRCVMESECVSVNYGPPTNDEVVCELSNSDHWHHPGDLQPRQGWVYRGAQNLCCSNPCLNNAKCLLGYTDKRYICVCTSGYTGEHCETDIDECSNGSHDCHQNAICVNTKGHFNCSCQTGYTGNGRLCREIDECSNGSHDCHQNATCINTDGHYNCNCKTGFTGNGRNCSDCSQKFHHLEKTQDLPTRGGFDVEHFIINGNRFLAFANYKSDTEGHNTDSFIYKQNDSTGNFFLYQTIRTHTGINMKYFQTDDKHYLAVTNHKNGTSYRLNSVIYQWNLRQEQFAVFQNIETFGGNSFSFFKIMNEQFLAITNFNNGSSHSINSFIYKWNSSKFEKIQDIATEGAVSSEAFAINNETFLAFAHHFTTQKQYSVQSAVFKWSGQQFVKLQSFPTYGARDVTSFNGNGSSFLAFANYRVGDQHNINSTIYKWNGSQFVLFQSIPTRGAAGLHPFWMCGQTFLGVANHFDDKDGHNTTSVIYRAFQEQFIKYQEISTQGAIDMTSFQYKGHTHLAVANLVNNSVKYSINSTLYKWT